MFICLLVGGVEGRGWKVYSRQSRFVVIYNFPKNRFVYKGGNTKFTRDGCLLMLDLWGRVKAGERRRRMSATLLSLSSSSAVVLVGHGDGEITIRTSNTSLPRYLYGGN